MSGRYSPRSARTALSTAAGGFLYGCAALFLLVPPAPAQEGANQDIAFCPESSAGAMLYGRVQDRNSGLVLPGSDVHLVWQQARGVADTIHSQLQAASDDSGFYRFCGVPSGVVVSVWASALGKTGSPATLYMEEGDRRHRQDLAVRLAESGRGSIVGSLLDRESGEPLGAALLRIERLDISTVADANGSFDLPDLPIGRHELTIRHVGHGEQSVEIEIVPDRVRHVEIALAPDPVVLAPITVTVEMRPVWLEDVGFYDRRAKSLGQFMGPEWMATRRPYRFSQVFENVPGVRMSPICRPHCYYWLRSTTRGGLCPLTFYIDGQRLRLGSVVDLDALVPASDVAAVEVYRGISQTPAQYFGQCGSVVIWTKRGSPPP